MISKNVQNMIPKIQEFLGRQPIKKAWLFGSCSQGEETTNSDVDMIQKAFGIQSKLIFLN